MERRQKIAALSRVFIWAVLTLVGSVAAASAAPAYPRIFNSDEILRENTQLFPQWSGMLRRMQATPEPFADACENPSANLCHLKSWNAFLMGLKGVSSTAQLQAVNSHMNHYPYIDDLVNWGMEDYWETPLEFLHKSGDCEDYAIAKYMSLRALGWPADALRIVVLQDLNLRISHAILVVYVNGEALVLDNQISHVVNARSIRHYRPIYSINELHWWLHRS